MSLPKISVIMLTYNRENLVGRAIESILNQSFSNFEFIIVNNGSTDQSGAIADKYASKDSRISVIHCRRGNIGSGRNIGLDVSKGEYISFIDDDDYVDPDFLEFLYNLAVLNNADISICGSFIVGFDKIKNGYVFDKMYIMNAIQATEEFLKRKLYSAGMPMKLIHRSLLNNIRFFEDNVYEDIRTTYRYFANAKTVAVHGVPKYYVFRHAGNNSGTATKFNMMNSEQLYEYLLAFKERTIYISELLPELGDFALYSEWSYMISMIEKIHRFELLNCNGPLAFMRGELRRNWDEFYNGKYIMEFEQKWMKKYVE
ncbi:glycosyltransferase family 2 protein [Acetobacterium wieringae]|uniref:glycosyltransferase family 2 protein n=1 Tax=Acetobacterium wieringae TaxID=52694 RepID=UPI0020338C25|nr:glycosyltransferase family 2 protein [Acetobacterium wieringae]URN85408.1 glycosyltransferase [Acetobacterium wieringae]